MNKDEALRCVDIAMKSLLEGNKEKALRFVLKAEKLHSTAQGKGTLFLLITENWNRIFNLHLFYFIVSNIIWDIFCSSYFFDSTRNLFSVDHLLSYYIIEYFTCKTK